MIETFSLKNDGDRQASQNFKIREFAQKDGKCDLILLDNKLVQLCQAVRDHFGAPVTIHSGYRSKEYNSGAPDSQHMHGRAADIIVKGVHSVTVALYAQNTLKAPGVGLYAYPKEEESFVHIDTRDGAWRGLQTAKNGGNTSLTKAGGFFPTVRKGSSGAVVIVLQRLLGISDDGKFGGGTEAAVKAFQSKSGLAADGICGALTWGALVKTL